MSQAPHTVAALRRSARTRRIVCALASLLLAAPLLPARHLAGQNAPDVETGRVAVGFGYFDAVRPRFPAGALELTWRGRPALWRATPQAGVMVSTDGGTYAHGGLAMPVRPVAWLTVLPSVGAGAYHAGFGLDLGYRLEFRSGVALELGLGDGTALSIYLYHLSNAGLGWRNPGVEVLGVAFSAPFAPRPVGRSR